MHYPEKALTIRHYHPHPQMNRPATSGIAGCGYGGPNLTRNFTSVSGCRVEAICDLQQDRLSYMQTLYCEVDVTTSVDELVVDPEIDAIVLATPVAHAVHGGIKGIIGRKRRLHEAPNPVIATFRYIKVISRPSGLGRGLGRRPRPTPWAGLCPSASVTVGRKTGVAVAETLGAVKLAREGVPPVR